MSLLHWGSQNYLYSRCGLSSAEWKGGTTSPSPLGNTPQSSQCPPGHQHPPWQQGHIASSHSTSCPPGPPGSSVQSWSVPSITGGHKQCGLNLETESLFNSKQNSILYPVKGRDGWHGVLSGYCCLSEWLIPWHTMSASYMVLRQNDEVVNDDSLI